MDGQNRLHYPLLRMRARGNEHDVVDFTKVAVSLCFLTAVPSSLNFTSDLISVQI